MIVLPALLLAQVAFSTSERVVPDRLVWEKFEDITGVVDHPDPTTVSGRRIGLRVPSEDTGLGQFWWTGKDASFRIPLDPLVTAFATPVESGFYEIFRMWSAGSSPRILVVPASRRRIAQVSQFGHALFVADDHRRAQVVDLDGARTFEHQFDPTTRYILPIQSGRHLLFPKWDRESWEDPDLEYDWISTDEPDEVHELDPTHGFISPHEKFKSPTSSSGLDPNAAHDVELTEDHTLRWTWHHEGETSTGEAPTELRGDLTSRADVHHDDVTWVWDRRMVVRLERDTLHETAIRPGTILDVGRHHVLVVRPRGVSGHPMVSDPIEVRRDDGTLVRTIDLRFERGVLIGDHLVIARLRSEATFFWFHAHLDPILTIQDLQTGETRTLDVSTRP